MASGGIYLNLDQLKSETISLNDKKIAEINKAINAAQVSVNRLTFFGWEGQSKDAFVKNFAEYKKEIVTFNEYLKVINKQLKTLHSNGTKMISQSNKVSAKL